MNFPQLSVEENLEIAVGASKFKDNVIGNLRQQIQNLRELAMINDIPIEEIEKHQYKHIQGIQ